MRLLHLLLFLAFTGFISVQAQPDDAQIGKWIKMLSIKKDPRESMSRRVILEISATDSATWCQTIQRINDGAKNGNIRSQIRAKILWSEMLPQGMICLQIPAPIDYFRDALQAAYEIEDEDLQYKIHLSLGQVYNGIGQYGLASMHFLMLFDILGRNEKEKYYLPCGAFYDLSFSHYHTHEYEACIKVGLNGLGALPHPRFQPDDTLNVYQQMLCWNTIGLAYHKIQKPDSAFLAFEKAEKIAISAKNAFWMGIINGNKGDVFYTLGQFDSAYVLLQYDYINSVAANQYDNAANSLQWIARIDLKEGRKKMALEKLQTAQQLLAKKSQANYLANVYYALSQVYTSLGHADSVNLYLQQYIRLHDSLETEITKNRMDILQIRLNNHDQIQTIKILNRQKKQISQTRNFTIILVVLIGCLGYMWMMRTRLKMQIRQREALEGKRIAEAETQKAIEQLDVFRLRLLEKNQLIEQWQSAYETKENAEDQNRRLSELSNHLILKEEDWVQFKALFDSVHPGFFISLRNKFPDITQAEQRMSALIKLKLTAKEASNLLGVSTNTVYKTRQRLRQRLGLESDAELEQYFFAEG